MKKDCVSQLMVSERECNEGLGKSLNNLGNVSCLTSFGLSTSCSFHRMTICVEAAAGIFQYVRTML